MDLGAILPATAAVISNILWGSSFMASKSLLLKTSPSMILVIRFSLAILALGAVGVIRKNNFQFDVFKSRSFEMVALGLVGYTGLNFFQMAGLSYLSTSQSASIMLLAPVITVFANSIIKQSFSFEEMILILVSFLGAIMILNDSQKISFSSSECIGVLLTFISAICLGLSVILTKLLLEVKSSGESAFSVFNLTYYSMVIGFFGLLLMAFFDQRSFIANEYSFDIQALYWLFHLGIGCSVFAFLLWNWSIKYLSSTVIAITMYLKTPIALCFGVILLSEKPGLNFYLGSFIIFSALMYTQFFKTKVK